MRFSGIYEPTGFAPSNYVEYVVDPILARYEMEPMANDLAVAATIVLWHTIDHIAAMSNNTLTDIRTKVRDIEPKIDYLHAAVTVIKHNNIEHSPAKFKAMNAVLQYSITLTINGETASTPPFYKFNDGANFPVIDLLKDCRLALGRFI